MSPGPPRGAGGSERSDRAVLRGADSCSLRPQRGQSLRATERRQSQDGRREEDPAPPTPGHQDAGLLER